ncbi:MAG: hypothetical protein OXB92_11665 [Acidimicrobiaceae bacterium]|nr:hypothetical protein [Acidimicrobiaceae bacterium]
MPELTPLSDRLRVAAAQFATGSDLDENLATCLRMLDAAVAQGADLVVLPEFCNHISVYDDAAHCQAVAVALDGPWLRAFSRRVAEHGVYAAMAVTIPRPDGRVTVTGLLFDPDGELLASADKQMLMGNERAFLSAGAGAHPVADTRFGPVGLYSCMDGVTFEIPRTLAVRGARLLMNNLNSFARDEASLHVPVRAAENGVFVVAANKVGPLLPADRVGAFSEALGVPPETLNGAGESQIVGPDGTVLAIAPLTGEAVVIADVDLSAVDPGRLSGRRPKVYAPLAQADTVQPASGLASEVVVACVPGARANPGLIDEAFASGASLVVLPELTPVPPVIPEGILVVTTVSGEYQHSPAQHSPAQHRGQVWSAQGLVHEQLQIHRSNRYPQVTDLGDSVGLYRTPFGDLAVLIADDHRYPEAMRLAAVAGAHIVVVCWQPEHAWECDLALLERAAENRVSLAACGPAGSPGAALLLDPPADSLWNPHRSSAYDGTINTPETIRAKPGDGMSISTLHPGRALHREVSKNTDLVAGRPWQASVVLSAAPSKTPPQPHRPRISSM